jgi:hypothetical protein
MSVNFPSEEPQKMERYLAILEVGAYPAMDGAPSMHQAPLYAMAAIPNPAEMILPGPGQKNVIAVNPQRQQAMRRLLPMWRY